MSSDLPVTNQAAQSIEPVQPDWQVVAISTWLATCLGQLVLLTYPLWLGSEFPQVPFVPGLGEGHVVDAALTALLMVALVVIVTLGLRPSRWRGLRSCHRVFRSVWVIVIAALLLLVLRDQHRLQPWVWQGAIAAVVVSRKKAAWRAELLVLTASIYGWSAWSKCDVTFIDTYGQQLVEAMLQSVGASTRWWSPFAKQLAAAALPVGELVVAGLMLWHRTTKWGYGLSLVMHVALLLAVGPLSLDHLPGVFLWNVYFIGQNVLLLRAVDGNCATSGPRWRLSVVVWFAALFPALRPLGWCDNWPAWAVYASGIERVTLFVHESAIVRLPLKLRYHLEDPRVHSGWRAIRIEQWSLAACRAPIYPQDRFFIAIALVLAEDAQLSNEMRVVWQSRAHWLTGERTVVELKSVEEIKAFAQRYWIAL